MSGCFALMWLLATAEAGGPPRVVGGFPAAAGAWPDVAALTYPWGTGCNGTLIASDLVLTAGHCAAEIETVILGTNDYAVPGETLLPRAVFKYPDSNEAYDVAVVQLQSASAIPPRPLALECTLERALFDGSNVAILGYGATDPGGDTFDTILMQAGTTVGDADCSDLSRGCRPAISPGGELVAGGQGVDSCKGDSGGPLYLLDRDEAWLVGVTSRAALPADTACGDGGIYVRPDAVVRWIQDATGRALDRPDCDGNQAPWPVGGTFVLDAGEVLDVPLNANDPDVADASRYAVIGTSQGDIALSNGLLSYTAPALFENPDLVHLRATDSAGAIGETILTFVPSETPIDSAEPADSDLEPIEAGHRACGCESSSGHAPPLVSWIVLGSLVRSRTWIGKRARSGRREHRELLAQNPVY